MAIQTLPPSLRGEEAVEVESSMARGSVGDMVLRRESRERRMRHGSTESRERGGMIVSERVRRSGEGKLRSQKVGAAGTQRASQNRVQANFILKIERQGEREGRRRVHLRCELR